MSCSPKENWLKVVGQEPTTPDELAYGIIKHINYFRIREKKLNDQNELIGFAWDVQLYPHILSYHSQPGGFLPKKLISPTEKPQPALLGHVWVIWKDRNRRLDLRQTSLIYTGLGGYDVWVSPFDKKYDVFGWMSRIWLDDFPCVNEYVQSKQNVVNTLSLLKGNDKNLPLYNHKFLWIDPEYE